MSLQIWLPLNGNLNNCGFDKSASLTTSVTYGAGKIGEKAYLTNTMTNTATFTNLMYKKEFTICYWLKIDSSLTYSQNYNDYFALGYKNGIDDVIRDESGGRVGVHQMLFPRDVATPNYVGRPNSTDAKDKWVHLTWVKNATEWVIYSDGVEVYKLACSSIESSTGYLTGTLTLGAAGTNGYLNDFRIYDECLSLKEIREISKGLVLHYPLNQPERSINLLPNSMKNTTSSSYGFGAITGLKLENNTTYTLTFNGRSNPKGDNRNLTVFIHETTWKYWYKNWTLTSETDTTVSYTFTTPDKIADYTVRVNSYYYPNSTTATNGNCTINWYKLEKGSNPNPVWTPNPADILNWGNTEYDISGFCHDATIASDNTLQTILNTPRYNLGYTWHSTKANPIYNSSKDFYFTDNFSWSVWVKAVYGSGEHYAFTVGRADAGGFGYALKITNNTLRLRFGTGSWDITDADDNWTHVAFTKSGNDIKIYKNGALVTSTTFSSTLPTYSDAGGVGIGCFRHTGGNIYHYLGSLSDFRIYCTALSADDIKDIYNAPISIAKEGNIISQGELVESSIVSINKNGILTGSVLNESKGVDLLNNSYKYIDSSYKLTGTSKDVIGISDMYTQVTPGKTYYLTAKCSNNWCNKHDNSGSAETKGKATIWLYLSKTYNASTMGYDNPICFTSNNWVREGVWKYTIPAGYNMARVRFNTYSNGTDTVTVYFNDIHLIEEANYIDGKVSSTNITKTTIVTNNFIEC